MSFLGSVDGIEPAIRFTSPRSERWSDLSAEGHSALI